jgi:DNA polymerase I
MRNKFTCEKCSFNARSPVLPITNKNSDILILFDTPSSYNDYDFGDYATKLFNKYNFKNYNIACLNRCFKSDRNRLDSYTDKEIRNCGQYFIEYFIKNSHIKYVLCLGMNAGKYLMKPEVDGEVVGKYVEKNGKFFYTTYNPADVNDRKWLRKKFESHLKRFFEYFYVNKTLQKKDITVNIINNHDDLNILNNQFEKLAKKKWPYFTFDIETNGLDTNKKDFKVLTISFSFNDESAFVIPVDHKENKNRIDQKILTDFLDKIFNNKKLLAVGHNAKFDILGLTKCFDIKITNLAFDTQLVWHTLFCDDKKGLKDIVYKLTDYGGYENEINKKQITNFEQIPLKKLMIYNGYDTALTYLVMLKELPLIEKRNAITLCHEIYPLASNAFTEMERTGMSLDIEALQKYKQEHLQKIKYLELKISRYPEILQTLKKLGETKFNANSIDHMKTLLFDVMQLKKVSDETAGTDKDSLKLYQRQNNSPLLQDLLDYSPIFKRYSTYLEKIEEKWIKEDGLMHTNLNMVGTANGRPSSNEPNFLNLPREKWYKSLFKPFDPKNYIFIHADYSQMELRVLASYSQDELMTKIFYDKKDPHTMTAASIFGIVEEAVQKIQRQIAKGVNFGISYGMGAMGLAFNLSLVLGRNVSVQEAQEYIDLYFIKFSGNKKLIEFVMGKVRKQGYIDNIFGRRRHLEKGKYGDKAAEREGINGLIQGTANDIMLFSLGSFWEWKEKNKIDAFLTLSVYDSILIAVRRDKDTIIKTARKLHEILTHPPYDSMRVPVEADVEIGADYGELFAFNYDKEYFEVSEKELKEEHTKFIVEEQENKGEKQYKINIKYFLTN